MKRLLTIIFLLISLCSTSQMVLNGTTTGGCDCYTLTTATDQEGSIWSPAPIDLTNPFDFTFRVNLGFLDGGADGIVFVLRKDGTATGVGGSL